MGDGTGNIAAATPGMDYLTPTGDGASLTNVIHSSDLGAWNSKAYPADAAGVLTNDGTGTLSWAAGGVVTPFNAGNITGTVTLNLANGACQYAALTGAVTLNAPANGVVGARLELWLTAAMSARVLTLDAAIHLPSDATPVFPKTLTGWKSYILVLQYSTAQVWWLTSVTGGY